MLCDSASRVVVADRDEARRDAMTQSLRHAGYVVEATSDAIRALHVVHKSAYPLIVILTADSLHVLNVAASDRRLTHHHAYIVLAPNTADHAPDCEQWYPHVRLRVLRQPIDELTLLDAVATAARALGLQPVI